MPSSGSVHLENGRQRETVKEPADNIGEACPQHHDTPVVSVSIPDLHDIIKAQHDLVKAVQADDAAVPVALWDERIMRRVVSAVESKAINMLCRLALQKYRHRLFKDCVEELMAKHGGAWLSGRVGKMPEKVQRDVAAMREVMWRAANNDWFEYPTGSRLHYFRFPARFRTLARDGVPNFFVQSGPVQRLPQPTPTPEAVAVLRDKIGKMIKKGYITPPETKLRSLIKYFAVPKGEGDRRVVYHAGANGLNDCVWAPPFHLPTVDALLRIVDHNSVMEDRDVGEMFLNFELHLNTRKFVRVDVRPLALESGDRGLNWLGWTKNLMGFKSSPFNSVKMYRICEEVVRGNRHDLNNAFQWDHVRLNLPGSREYNPSEGWLTKRRKDGSLASDFVVFVDDKRVAGGGSERVQAAGHALSSGESYLGATRRAS